MVRRSSTENFERIEHLRGQVEICQADLLDQLSLITLLRQVRSQEVYNLASMSFVPTSWDQPVLTGEFTALGVTRMLEAVRLVNPEIRFCLKGRVPTESSKTAANAWTSHKMRGREWT